MQPFPTIRPAGRSRLRRALFAGLIGLGMLIALLPSAVLGVGDTLDVHRALPDRDARTGSVAPTSIQRAIVADLPGGWISGAQEYLLAAYCRHIDAGNWLSKQIDGLGVEPADIPRLSRLLGMRIRETGAMMSLATKMRLTQQARMHPRTAGRATSDENGGRKLWERRPWESD